MKKNKELTKLRNAYKKQLEKCAKADLEDYSANFEYLVTYLRFLRDYFILTEDILIGDTTNIKIASIATAIKEYEAYKTCIDKYFIIEKNGIIQKNKDLTHEEVMKLYQEEKDLHFKKFMFVLIDSAEVWKTHYVTF